MQGLYDTATLLDSSCFSTPSGFNSSYDCISDPYYNMNIAPDPRRTAKVFGSRKPRQPPAIAGMDHASIPRFGPSVQEQFLTALAAHSEHQSTSSVLMESTLLQQRGQLPGHRTHTSMLNFALAVELKDDITDASDQFIERLFPQSRLPFPIDKSVFDALATAGYWDNRSNCFKRMLYTEEGMARWLNDVGNIMGKTNPGTRDNIRQWWHGSCQLPPGGAYLSRKPDLVLLDERLVKSLSAEPRRIDWLHIRSFAEVTQEKPTPKRIIHTINAKTYLQFIVQFNRRFVPALSFNGAGKYSLTLTDREGQIRSGGSLTSKGLEPARLFLTILAFLMFGKDSDIGLDPHFIRDSETDALIEIDVDGKRYRILRHIYKLESLLGRGTNVWIVSRDDVQYVLKDSWVQADRVESEINHLTLMKDHAEIESMVPTFIGGGDVMIDGVLDSTASYRGAGLIGRPRNQRVHRRIITTPIGAPLTTFRSKKEFIKALQTIIFAHKYLCENIGVLHRDISIGNILLYRVQEGQEATGLLVDFDFSTTFVPETVPEVELGEASSTLDNPDGANTVAAGNDVDEVIDNGNYVNSQNATGADERIWTGTPPFVAIEALINFPDPYTHGPHHDLESVLYVILYFCTYYKGPGQMRVATDFHELRSIPLERWFRKESLREIGRSKLALVSTYERSLLANFTPYWSDFTPFVARLIEACFPDLPRHSSALTHDGMINILKDAYETVQETQESTISQYQSSRASRPKKPKASGSRTKAASAKNALKRRKLDV